MAPGDGEEKHRQQRKPKEPFSPLTKENLIENKSPWRKSHNEIEKLENERNY